MDQEPTPVGTVIDNALAELLGPEGFEFYLTLTRQTQQTRERILADVRDLFAVFRSDELARLKHEYPHLGFEHLETLARVNAQERVQRERDQRLAVEEAAFREKTESLFKWVAKTLDGECEGCGE